MFSIVIPIVELTLYQIEIEVLPLRNFFECSIRLSLSQYCHDTLKLQNEALKPICIPDISASTMAKLLHQKHDLLSVANIPKDHSNR